MPLTGTGRGIRSRPVQEREPHIMSIRLIAKDLYRLTREVEALEHAVEEAPEGTRRELEERLHRVRAERDRMRAVLEGSKEEPAYRRPR